MTTDVLWQKTLVHLSEGNFTALEKVLGGPEGFDRHIADWYRAGKFASEPGMLAEALSCACMLGRNETAAFLIDSGVDPYAGMKTWLAGPHYAVSGGHLATLEMLVEKGVSLEVENRYGGTLLSQALWSAINEHKETHCRIIELLIEAGAVVEPGTAEWWDEQQVPSGETKRRVAEILRQHAEFQQRLGRARELVADARTSRNKLALADALKELGNLERRPPVMRDAANKTYAEAAELFLELDRPLDAAWIERHIGINHEYAGNLIDAERLYDEALALYRENSREADLNFANAVRYPAAIKGRLGKRDEASELWEEALGRYKKVGIVEGVAEAAARLTILAIEKGDFDLADKWFAVAEEASGRSDSTATHRLVSEVRTKMKNQ